MAEKIEILQNARHHHAVGITYFHNALQHELLTLQKQLAYHVEEAYKVTERLKHVSVMVENQSKQNAADLNQLDKLINEETENLKPETLDTLNTESIEPEKENAKFPPDDETQSE